MQDTRNSQICIAVSDRAGRPSAVQIGGSASVYSWTFLVTRGDTADRRSQTPTLDSPI